MYDNVTGRFIRKNHINDNFFDKIGEEQACILGLFASDGFVRNSNHMGISQSHEAGRKLLLAIALMMDFTGELYYTEKHDFYSLYFSSLKIVQRLADFGIVRNKTLGYIFPEALPLENLAAFMRGYIDGDGCVGIYSQPGVHMIRTSLLISFVGTPTFVNQVNTLLPVSGNVNTLRQAKNLVEFRVYGRKAVELGKWLWRSPHLPQYYKQEIFDVFMRDYYPQRRYAKKVKVDVPT
jgi:hypothetical protein